MQTVRLLIAEDSDLDFDFISQALHESGFSTNFFRARDGAEAIEYLTGQGPFVDRTAHPLPDVVLLDLKMPRMNGFELLEWLEANPQHRVIPTIVMSSSAAPPDVERAYQLNAHSYFVKPIDYAAFIALFQRIAAYWASAQTPGSARREAARV